MYDAVPDLTATAAASAVPHAPTAADFATIAASPDPLGSFAHAYPQLCAGFTILMLITIVAGNACRLVYKPEYEETHPRLAGALQLGMTLGNVAVGALGFLHQAFTGRKTGQPVDSGSSGGDSA